MICREISLIHRLCSGTNDHESLVAIRVLSTVEGFVAKKNTYSLISSFKAADQFEDTETGNLFAGSFLNLLWRFLKLQCSIRRAWFSKPIPVHASGMNDFPRIRLRYLQASALYWLLAVWSNRIVYSTSILSFSMAKMINRQRSSICIQLINLFASCQGSKQSQIEPAF